MMNKDTNQLLPCPFCGGDACTSGGVLGDKGTGVFCVRCYVSMPGRGLDHDKAIEAWNKRVG